MKLLIVSQHFHPETFRINEIAATLVKNGHQIVVLTGLPNYPKGKLFKGYSFFRKRFEVIKSIQIYRVPIITRGKSILRLGLNYLSFVISACLYVPFLKEEYDSIFVFQTSPITMAIPAILAKMIHKKPLIIYCLDQWPISVSTGPIKESSLTFKLLKKLSIWIYKKADRILISSKSFKDYFEKELSIYSEIYGLNYWPSFAEDTYLLKNKIENDSFDLLFAGNIGPAQNVELIIEAANLLRNHTFIKFHIVGDGLNLEACKELSKTYQLENVFFYGHHPVSEMHTYYELADAFLITMVDNPIVNMTLPAKIQSYLLASKPIIGSISGEVQNVVEDAHCGWIVPPNDLDGFCSSILEASQSTETLNIKGKNALNYYYKHFSKDVLIKELLQHIEDLNHAN